MPRFLLASLLALVAAPALAAGYTPQVNYMLNCMGCHLPDGAGSKPNDTPRMKDFVGYFLKVPGGRQYLIQVPGSSQSRLDDADLAALMNYIIEEIGGPSRPADFVPYTAAEVTRYRAEKLMDVKGTRARLIRELQALGIEEAP
ncbi:MAG TPA: cytochrome C [Candidatus Competibacteraceae bacterium]|nr:cytochrome C [Candidatus Competibacteraceae bacterium]